ncbi:transporter substrate-binding domain-containing protein [Mesorhizobium sp. M2C.T.Ca.TU.002.02.1.1]|uniref:transporter substrate-binding domain-containing protein n=1 Tax=Mesorhizobium sp. M2C.T.Ca.TU.002.02.1.1 TaxID=2496788 RepID=UPI000FCB068A|nr:transporter substrate-binding domain-containing protein [Mesorhizobium sp. M2C.T.Ca.TU.002.02.1.1]RUU60721.1 transporter substrate-binding domain-containing protein [Mesorhizobium sp. M2C.T.Ca.TU.002.02.1.1]RUU68552.1 transporter substrate-binding domain-containing protein [Mesorhizobium sp. M2C.T.Ca.TU.009.01.2.1]
MVGLFSIARRSALRLLAAAPLLILSTVSHADGLVDQIKQRGTIVVGTEAAFEPFEFVRDGQIVGYNKDILDYVVAKLGVKLDQLNLPFQGLLPGLLAKKFDLMATSTGINAERAAKYAYTRPTGSFENVIVVRANEDRIKKPEDINGMVVATQLASSVQPVIEAYDKELKAKGGGIGEIKLFTSFPETHVALASGQVDAIVIASPSAAVLMKNVPDTYKIVGSISGVEYLAWVVRPEDKDLRDLINASIGELKDSGKLKELQLKWFGFEMQTPDQGYLPPGAL